MLVDEGRSFTLCLLCIVHRLFVVPVIESIQRLFENENGIVFCPLSERMEKHNSKWTKNDSFDSELYLYIAKAK